MFKKTIKFENFNGDTVEKEFYFHMSKTELLEMAADGNSMMERIKRIIAAGDGKAIIEEFRALIRASVGMRSEDNQRFIKNEEAQSYLMDSPALDELLMELCTNANAAAEFVNQLIPAKMQQEMQQRLAQQQDLREDGSIPDPFRNPDDDRPGWLKEGRVPTDVELRDATREQLEAAFRLKMANKAL